MAQLERELTEKNERMAVLESTVDKLDDLKDDLSTTVVQGDWWARKCQEETNQLQARVDECESRIKALEVELMAAREPPADMGDCAAKTSG